MHIKNRYSLKEMILWTRKEIIIFIVIIVSFVSFYYFLDLAWFKIPWTPIALIGTAVAFVIGFQNNSAYGRIWEARKIWGGIVNTSRTLGMYLQDMITNEHAEVPLEQHEINQEIKVIIYRHIAWVTALRHAMRSSMPWETVVNDRTKRDWDVKPPEFTSNVDEEMKAYISEEDLKYVLSKSNKQTAILYLQSHHLRTLKEKGAIWEFSFLELEGIMKELFSLQGKSERIKNFPYPRQFATLNHLFIWIFVLLLPLALVPQFAEIGREFTDVNPIVSDLFVWFCVPFYVLVAWIFHTMERIGRYGENPFEGTPNDVPISSIARGIEIDLRQNLGESLDEIPKQYPIKFHTQF